MNPEELIAAHLDGTLDEAASKQLNAWLKAAPENMDRFTTAVMFDQEIWRAVQARESDQAAQTLAAIESSAQMSPSRWQRWSPITAAAAGLVAGLFCASVVFAYVAPSWEKVVTLFADSFESGPAPLVAGVPLGPGRWSGDYSEVVGEQQGVKPASGKKMLRLLRGDFEGKKNAAASHVADIYRLIDVRPYRREFADGSAVVQLSAGFNAFEFPLQETYYAKLTLFAFDAETATNGSLRIASSWDENCLASAGAGSVKLDRNPATWQRLNCELRVPARTDFLLVHLYISAGTGTHPETGFAGHFIDDVRLTMVRRKPLP